MIDRKIKVLMIEDNLGDVRLIKEMLGEAPGAQFNLEYVDRLKTGLKRLEEGGIDLVFLDLGLPDSQGIHTFLRVKSQEQKVPIIVLTGLKDEELAIKAVRNGAQDYLVKGQVDGNLLVHAMRYAIERKRAEQSLRESEEMYRTLMKTSPDAVTVTDLEAKIIEVSQQTLILHGFKRAEELIGRNALELIAPEEHEKAIMNIHKTLEKGVVRDVEYILLRKDGTRFIGELNASLIKDAYGEPKAFIAITRDITERKQAEKALQTEKTYLDRLFESAQEAIVMVDNNHRVVRINSEFTRLFGYTPDEALGRTIDELVSSGDLRKEGASYTKQLAEGKRIAFESLRRHKNGTLVPVSAIGAPIIVNKEQVGYYAIYRDITQRKKAEENLERRATQAALIYKVGLQVSEKLELETLLSEIVTSVQDAFNYYGVMLFLFDEKSKYLTLKSITGGHANIMPKDLSVAIGEGMIGHAAASGKTQCSGKVSDNPQYIRFAYEKTKSELSVPIKSGNKIIGVLDIQSDEFDAFDESDVAAMETLSVQIASAIENARLYENAQREITERKRAEVKLSESLREKEVLLKEIHHRVKNNMQIISSLLRLQSSHIKDKKMQEMFNVSQDRIKSMALIHERLYQSKDLARIDFSDYLRSLTDNISSIYRTGVDSVDIKLDIKEFYIDIDTAIPLGLIVNELVSNSLKHAFPKERMWGERGKSRGEILLSLCSDDGGRVILVIRDNGVGLPEDFDFRKSESLGLKLVNDLVDQLDGSIELQRRKGTSYKITFKVPR